MPERIDDAFRDLGDVVGAIEAGGASVTDVDAAEEGLYADGSIGIELDLTLPVLAGDPVDGVEFAVSGASIDDAGSLHLALVVTRPTGEDVAAGGDAGSAAATAAASDGSEAEDDVGAGEGRGGLEAEAEDVGGDSPGDVTADPQPAYRDPERLREVYEAYDSFPAMTEALGVDVTPQTVRRHMIEHGIHEPGRDSGPGSESDGDGRGGTETTDGEGPDAGGDAETSAGQGDAAPAGNGGDVAGSAGEAADGGPDGSDGSANPPAGSGPRSELVASSGLGLPEDVTVEELSEVVRTARTIREVAQRLDVPRERAFRLLNALDLVDLVSGRLETADRSVSHDEIDQRIARATASGE